MKHFDSVHKILTKEVAVESLPAVVKEVARFGGSVAHMVPPVVAEDLMRFFNSAFNQPQR